MQDSGNAYSTGVARPTEDIFVTLKKMHAVCLKAVLRIIFYGHLPIITNTGITNSSKKKNRIEKETIGISFY